MKLTLTNIAKEIAKTHREILGSLKMTIEKAIYVGELLVEAKGRLKHGLWLPWLKNNVPFAERTVNNYMACFKRRAYFKSANFADLSDAYSFIERMNYVQKQLPAPSKNGATAPKGRRKKGKTFGQAMREATERGDDPGPILEKAWKTHGRTVQAEVAAQGEKHRVKFADGLTPSSTLKAMFDKCDAAGGKKRFILGGHDIKVTRLEICDYPWAFTKKQQKEAKKTLREVAK